MRRGLQPLPDVATRRRTRENKGHVNYDLSDVPVKARAAPTTGMAVTVWYQRVRNNAKNCLFFGESA
jgi:hypothetical protein